MNIEQARFNMIEQQIRTWEVLDQAVLTLLSQVKREDFVPAAYRGIAFTDMEIPLGHGQAMLSPKMEARILQEVAPKASDSVLELGTGAGYQTALLASRSAKVLSIEIFDDLSKTAAANLARAGFTNVVLKVGDAALSPDKFSGADEKFDVIVITGSTPVLPTAYLDRLQVNGRLFAVIGDAPVMKATLFTRQTATTVSHIDLFETVVTPLINAPQPSRFDF